MKKLLLYISLFLILLGCQKEEEEVLVPSFEIALDGVEFDPFERYAVINTFGGERMGLDGNLKKIFILYLQIEDEQPRLDRQHFALYVLDSDANDNGEVIVHDAGQSGGAHTGLISLTAIGEFYNPYIQRTMTVDLSLLNWPIGLDINATPYGYLLD